MAFTSPSMIRSLGSPLRQAVLVLAATLAVPALAVTDPLGDFLPTYTGVQGADLDVLQADVTYDAGAQTFTFSAVLAGAVGSTSGALYVWGLDRGQGTARFQGGSPSIGEGVLFDGVLIVRPDGSGQFNDFIHATQTVLSTGSVLIDGASVQARVEAALLPSTGFDVAAYTWNLWPRLGLGNNAQVSDFAPNGSNAALNVVAVPEPSGAALLLTGLLLLTARSIAARKTRRTPASETAARDLATATGRQPSPVGRN